MIERRYERKSVFVAATLHDGRSSSPVTVRNISRSGAMAESRCPPTIGAEVSLVRGRLKSEGEVIWSNDRKFGVRFKFPIMVEDWVVGPKNASQCISDQLFAQRASSTPTSRLQAAAFQTQLHSTTEGGLAEAIALLISGGDQICEDTTVVAQHGESLQKLDRAIQILSAIQRSAGGSAGQ